MGAKSALKAVAKETTSSIATKLLIDNNENGNGKKK